MAHEIRNPVAMIVSSLSLARRGEMERFEKEGMCDIVVSEAERLEKLTTEFLEYARVKPPDARETSLETTVGYVGGIAKARAEEAGIAIETDAPEGASASFDPFQVHQALLNLVLNGIEATPSGESVTVGAGRSPDGGVRFFVENGAGPIPNSVAGNIFEPFYSTKDKGTGLGLSIARNIARAHGGSLDLAVNEPGRVRFEMLIPAPDEPRRDDGENSGR
jgi:signal transduction histidine kinase